MNNYAWAQWLRTVTAGNAWRDLTTVPEGEPVLLFCPRVDRGLDGCEVGVCYRSEVGGWEFWTNGGPNAGSELWLAEAPTHWMPLPPPPEN